jgi:hypothetical protein
LGDIFAGWFLRNPNYLPIDEGAGGVSQMVFFEPNGTDYSGRPLRVGNRYQHNDLVYDTLVGRVGTVCDYRNFCCCWGCVF